MSDLASLVASVSNDLQFYISSVRERNRETIKELAERDDEDDVIYAFNEPDEFDFEPSELLDRFDELNEQFNLDGITPRPPREYSEEFLEPAWSTTLKNQVKQEARPGVAEDLELPLELKILFSMVDSLTGSGLPKHQSNTEVDVHGGISGINAQFPDEIENPLDVVEAYDRDGRVEIGAGWAIGEQDADGLIPWAIWCRVVDKADATKELKPWKWRYVVCSFDNGGYVLETLRDFLEKIATQNPEQI